MRRKLAWMLAAGPLFSVAYFLRAGETSFYIFDPYSLVLVLMALAFVSGRRLMLVVIGCLLFVTVSAIGLMFTANTYGMSRSDQFVVGSLRYTQMIVVTYTVIMLGRNSAVPVKSYAIGLFLLAACVPLVAGLALLQVRPESVLVFDRFSSYLSNPNNVGAFICVAIPAVNYALGFLSDRRQKLAISLVFYSSAVLALFYAGSNSGWFLCAVSFAVSMLSMKGRVGPRVFMTSVVMVAIVTLALTAHDWLLSSDIHGLRNTGEMISALRYGEQFMDLGSGRLRESLTKDAWELYLSSPFVMMFGVGLGQSPMMIGAKYAANITAHNAFLVLLLETGLIGISVLTVLVVNAVRFVRVWRDAIPVLVGYLLAMQGTPHVYLPFLWALMSFALYLMCAAGNASNVGKER